MNSRNDLLAKKLGQTYMTEYHPLNPVMHSLGPGAKLKAYVCAHGERLIEGTMKIEQRITRSELPRPMGLPTTSRYRGH